METAPLVDPVPVQQPAADEDQRARATTPTLDEIISDAANTKLPNEDLSNAVSPEVDQTLTPPKGPGRPTDEL